MKNKENRLTATLSLVQSVEFLFKTTACSVQRIKVAERRK